MNKLIEQVLERFDKKFKWFPMMSPNNEVKGKPMVKQFLKEELTNLIEKVREDKDKWLDFFSEDISSCFIPKCTWCSKIATEQTAKGKDAQKNNHRPINWGYYCKKCYAKGLKLEEEAMYG